MSYKKNFNQRSTTDSNNHMKTLTLRIPAEQFEELNRRAAEVGINRSDYCRDLLFSDNPESVWPRYHFASNLCKHHNLVDQLITDADGRQRLFDWYFYPLRMSETCSA